MSKLWVKFGSNDVIQVDTTGCNYVDDFIEACQKKLQIPNPPQEGFLSLNNGGEAFKRDDPIPAQNSAKKPLFINVSGMKSAVGIVNEKATFQLYSWKAHKTHYKVIKLDLNEGRIPLQALLLEEKL
jgi:hypothetical protein